MCLSLFLCRAAVKNPLAVTESGNEDELWLRCFSQRLDARFISGQTLAQTTFRLTNLERAETLLSRLNQLSLGGGGSSNRTRRVFGRYAVLLREERVSGKLSGVETKGSVVVVVVVADD